MADTTLRDYQHANRFYSTSNFAHAPKVKFLYHVVFTLTDEALAWSYAMQTFGKEMSVLVKEADLPSYSAQVETKKQYNRVKHFQTKVNYDSVSIRFHDDNLSITSQLLEDYYTYYFRDGLKRNDSGSIVDYDPRDKLGAKVPHYGLENRNKPFFANIKIFQLQRGYWRSYTLINPLVEKWQHDTVAAAEGTGIMENSISVVYEGVVYNEGEITDNGDPAGFRAQETAYDPTPTWITQQSGVSKQKTPLSRVPVEDVPQRFTSNSSITPPLEEDEFRRSLQASNQKEPGGIPNQSFPKGNAKQSESTIGTANIVKNVDSDDVANLMNQPANASAKDSFAVRCTRAGMSSTSYDEYQSMSPEEKSALQDELVSEASSGDRKKLQMASQALAGSQKSNNAPGKSDLNYPTGAGEPPATDKTNAQANEIEKTTSLSSAPNANGTNYRGATEEELSAYNATRTTVNGRQVTKSQIKDNPYMNRYQKKKAIAKIDRQVEAHQKKYGNTTDVNNELARRDQMLIKLDTDIKDTDRQLASGNLSDAEKKSAQEANEARKKEYLEVQKEKEALQAQSQKLDNF